MTQQPYIFQNMAYSSAAATPSWFRKTFPDAGFYLPLLMIVLRAGLKAGKGLYDSEAWVRSSEEVVANLEASGCRIEATGMENFRTLEEPCIFIGNHMSTLETFVLPSIIQPWKDVTFVVKESLLKYPFFGKVLGSRNPIVVGRTNPREDLVAVMDGGNERLRAGRSIIIFPQSTRTPVFDPAHFNTIGVKLARKTGAPVIPIALKTDAWGNGEKLKDFGPITPSRTIHFEFGEPVHISGTGKEEHQHISDFIMSRLEAWGKEENALPR